jgi:hypothetical protein
MRAIRDKDKIKARTKKAREKKKDKLNAEQREKYAEDETYRNGHIWRANEWYQKHKEEKLEYQKLYAQINSEYIQQYKKEYREEYGDDIRQKANEHRHIHKDEINAAEREARHADPTFNSRRREKYATDEEYRNKILAWHKTAKARLTDYKNSAKKSKRTFALTLEQFEAITSQKCHYCQQYSKGRDYCGIDRKDNNIGYEIDNCLPCCAEHNFLRGDYSYEEFISLCHSVNPLHSAFPEACDSLTSSSL